MKNTLLKRLGIGLSLCYTSIAHAATDTANMTVDATVVASCTITVNSLNFGDYNLSQLDGTATISPTCTNGTSYSIALDAGTGTGATTTTRKMTNGANTLNYSLYQDSGRTTVWGTGNDDLDGTGSGSAQNITVYGRIPADQSAPAGTYTDTVIVTITF